MPVCLSALRPGVRNKNWMRGKEKGKTKVFRMQLARKEGKKREKEERDAYGKKGKKKKREDEERGKGDEEGWMMFRD